MFVTRRRTGTFYVSIQNDGLVAAAFTIKGTGAARGYTVRYYRGAVNVTAQVKAGTYSTGAIGARSAITLRMIVTLSASAAATGSFLVKATSIGGDAARCREGDRQGALVPHVTGAPIRDVARA